MRRILVADGLCMLLLLLWLLVLDPTHLTSIALVVPFVLMFGCLFLTSLAVIRKSGRGRTRTRRIAALLATLPVLLLILQSIGQLSLREFFSILALFAVSYVYVARTAVVDS